MMGKGSQPPALAAWLLRHLVSKRDREALIGDLVERFGEGKSEGWFWRQVVMAIVVGGSRGLRERWPEICFSVVGTAVLWFWAGRLIGKILEQPVMGRAWDWSVYLPWPWSMAYDQVFRCGVAALMVQPILAALLLLGRGFRWMNLVRTFLVSLPLIVITGLAWEVWPAESSMSIFLYLAGMWCTLWISVWMGCRGRWRRTGTRGEAARGETPARSLTD
jgi:hypothetical protein